MIFQKLKNIRWILDFDEQHEERGWRAKDLVYRVQCRVCGWHYTGETGQELQKRFYYHWYGHTHGNEEESALAEHFLHHHPEEPMKLKLIETVKTRGYVDRKSTESIVVQSSECNINRRIEGAGTIGNLYLTWCDRRRGYGWRVCICFGKECDCVLRLTTFWMGSTALHYMMRLAMTNDDWSSGCLCYHKFILFYSCVYVKPWRRNRCSES